MADIIKDDFIKRSDALLAVFDLYVRDCSALLNNGIPYQHIKNALRTIKAIDVQPVRRARWKCESIGCYYCSLCNEQSLVKTKFCGNCGADMRGGA